MRTTGDSGSDSRVTVHVRRKLNEGLSISLTTCVSKILQCTNGNERTQCHDAPTSLLVRLRVEGLRDDT